MDTEIQRENTKFHVYCNLNKNNFWVRRLTSNFHPNQVVPHPGTYLGTAISRLLPLKTRMHGEVNL